MKKKIVEFINMNLADTLYFLNEDMKKHTTFKTGGPADILVEPQNIDELQKLMKFVLNEGIPYVVIGHGSNLIVSDKGIRDLIIKVEKNLSKCVISNESLEAEAGAAIVDVSREAQKKSLSGLEFACGIPVQWAERFL